MAAALSYLNALNTAKKVQPAKPKPVVPMSPEVAQRIGQTNAQAWINNPKSGMGGMDAYTKKQNEKYAGAADQTQRDSVTADSQRVGYTLTGGGVVGGGVDVGSKTGKGTEAGVNTGSQAISNSQDDVPSGDPYADKAKLYTGQLDTYRNFKYDINTDPSYLALSQANMANAKVANRDMEEEMNSRGIGNSTVTTDRAAEIYKQGADATTLAIPQLQANAYNQNHQNFTDTLGLANQYQSMSNNAFDRNMKTADVTGQYRAPEVNSLIQTVLDAKANYGKPGVDQKALGQAADLARGKLAEYGVDPSLFGSNVTLGQAQGNVAKAYIPTMAAQQGNANLISGLASKYPTVPAGTGNALKNAAPSYGKAADFYKTLEGIKTMEGLTNEQRMLAEKLQLSLSTRNTDISAGHLGIAKDRLIQDQADGKTKKEQQKSTDAAIQVAVSKDTKKEAYAYVADNMKELNRDGVDTDRMLDYITKLDKWDPEKAVPATAPSILTSKGLSR